MRPARHGPTIASVPPPEPTRAAGRGMDPVVARRIAWENHRGQRNRFGDPVIEHVARVVAAVSREARAVAWLHDLFELTPIEPITLRGHRLTATEGRALRLLTRSPHETYRGYVLRIASARGRAGAIARVVKLADLDDHLAHGRPPPGAPPYAWARGRVLERMEVRMSTALAG
jgi:hypothetical protein